MSTFIPDHWLDHEIIIELRFAVAPDATTREAIAAAFEVAAHGTAIAGARPWLWADRYVLVELAERYRGPLGWRDDLPAIVAAVNAVAPVDRALFLGPGAHGIDPADGPRWGGWAADRTTRHTDGDWRGEIDERVEAARARAGAEAAAAAAADARARADDGELALVPCDDLPPIPAALPAADAQRLVGDRAVLPLPARCVAVAPDGTLAIGDAAELHLIDGRGHRSFAADYPSLLAFVRDGRGLIVGMEDRRFPTVVLGLRNGVVREVGRLATEIAGPYRTAEIDGRIVSSSGHELLGFDAAWTAAFAGDPADDDVDLEEG